MAQKQWGTLCSSSMSPSSQATTPGFISSHGGGSDITSSQKSAQRGCTEAIKWFFWAQNLAVPKKPWEKSVEAIFWRFWGPWVWIWSHFGAKKNHSGTRKYEGFGCPQQGGTFHANGCFLKKVFPFLAWEQGRKDANSWSPFGLTEPLWSSPLSRHLVCLVAKLDEEKNWQKW